MAFQKPKNQSSAEPVCSKCGKEPVTIHGLCARCHRKENLATLKEVFGGKVLSIEVRGRDEK